MNWYDSVRFVFLPLFDFNFKITLIAHTECACKLFIFLNIIQQFSQSTALLIEAFSHQRAKLLEKKTFIQFFSNRKRFNKKVSIQNFYFKKFILANKTDSITFILFRTLTFHLHLQIFKVQKGLSSRKESSKEFISIDQIMCRMKVID